uniref:Ribosomal protein S11, chloroplastic n=1 Tax=Tanacetum cinerariifolium TaxID=118510 RepID=A0A6L2L0W0_TANCI|nr:ribosomal protein S11, chloroplastic [Tanacetum cinerariifolium]
MMGATTGSEFKIGDSVRTTRVPLLVVIPFRSSFGLVIVLPGRVPEPEDKANGTICLHEIGKLIGGYNLRLRNLGLMNQSLVNRSLISWRRVLTMDSSLEELVSPLVVVPLRIMVSLIPVLVLKVLIVTILILVETWCSIDGITMSQSQTVIEDYEIGKNYGLVVSCHSLVQRTGRSPGPSTAISKSFKKSRINTRSSSDCKLRIIKRVVLPWNYPPYTPLRVCLTFEGEPYLESDTIGGFPWNERKKETGSRNNARLGSRKSARRIPKGLIHVQASFNNTIVTVTDVRGRVVYWATAGTCGFWGTRRGTPFSAQTAAGNAIRTVVEQGTQRAKVMKKGPGLRIPSSKVRSHGARRPFDDPTSDVILFCSLPVEYPNYSLSNFGMDHERFSIFCDIISLFGKSIPLTGLIYLSIDSLATTTGHDKRSPNLPISLSEANITDGQLPYPLGIFSPLQLWILGNNPRFYDLRLGVARSPAIESVFVGRATSSFEMRRIAQDPTSKSLILIMLSLLSRKEATKPNGRSMLAFPVRDASLFVITALKMFSGIRENGVLSLALWLFAYDKERVN